jgi:hypothetical protein
VIAISAHGHYLQKAAEGGALPDLDSLLRPLCAERYRRIDRFTELALLGSGLCAQGRILSPGCALYLGSQLGPIGNNIQVQETLFKNRQLPKPFHFVNTLGSSAGYYVCKNLGLGGQALFLSGGGASLQAVLMSALTDMDLGIVSQALVGVVEESAFPLGDWRAGLNLPGQASMAEGSHWLLLEAGAAPKGGASIALKKRDFLNEEGADLVLGPEAPDASSGYHPSLNAAAVTTFLGRGGGGRLALLDGDDLFLIQK